MKATLEDRMFSEHGYFKMTINCDGWINVQGHHLMNIMVVNRYGEMFMTAIDASNKVKMAVWQAKHLVVEIRRLGPTNVLQFVADNASVNVKTRKLIHEEFPHIQWGGCATHGLDLLYKDIGKLKWVKDLFKLCAEKVKYIKNHHMMNTMFLDDFSDDLTLLKPRMTRFMTNFIMID
ncbi:hypothetical protein R1flu_003500 [Riccia fluitans]|uniref:DUF659 domain-containing protein n=1 Tax=Riccia fluitans TaxID=41844 RepID=A0ABD1Y989_9MARC